ncbi:hypothetical protein [Chryseobacterium sp.]|uniref:hypothetical protein n=1 Tax=Chryseobacterium sp. TaxID=1871047 RepID=UPI0028A0C3D7|nr:hypothetical protein [Chryseobacterium sp.]
MITKIIFSIIVVLCLGCKAQNKNISEQEIYDVINFILKNGTVKYHKELKLLTEDPNITTDQFFDKKLLQTYFDEKNADFILEQFFASKDFRLSYKYIIDRQIIHIDKMLSYKTVKGGLWSFLADKYKEEGFMFVGKPLFTLDKKSVIITYGYYCGGLCGKGSRVILKKVNNNWAIEKEVSGFVS